jgi:hypothetical protein
VNRIRQFVDLMQRSEQASAEIGKRIDIVQPCSQGPRFLSVSPDRAARTCEDRAFLTAAAVCIRVAFMVADRRRRQIDAALEPQPEFEICRQCPRRRIAVEGNGRLQTVFVEMVEGGVVIETGRRRRSREPAAI